MRKKIGLKQLAQKKYVLVKGLDQAHADSLGEIEDAFDMIIYGGSGNGKSNYTVEVVKALVLALNCKCEYVSYEEGHAKTMQDTMIMRHNMLELLGNKLQLVDHYSYDELYKEMSKRRSAKIWVIDSLQASHFTEHQCARLKEDFILSTRRKIIIYISWSEGQHQSIC
jgi:predicted ATP-dependent serine protease